jgi:hypothetical protein
MGNSLSKLKLEALNVNEISQLVTNIGGDYQNYCASIMSSDWDGEYAVFQYDENSLDLEIIGITDKAHVSFIKFQIAKIYKNSVKEIRIKHHKFE